MIVAGHGYNDPGAVGNGTNERDFIRKNITPQIAKYLRQAGHEVALYGGSKQSQDMYQDTAYGVRVGNKKIMVCIGLIVRNTMLLQNSI